MSPEPLDYQTPRSRDDSPMTCPRCGGSTKIFVDSNGGGAKYEVARAVEGPGVMQITGATPLLTDAAA